MLQGIVERYQGSAILEVQARSCEYSHMFKLDGMRAALLEHIPPLDESTYTRNLGNSQVIDAAGAAQVIAYFVYHDQCSLVLAVSPVHMLCVFVVLMGITSRQSALPHQPVCQFMTNDRCCLSTFLSSGFCQQNLTLVLKCLPVSRLATNSADADIQALQCWM